MLCRNCSKKEATTHIRSIIAGETAETHLCAECAAALGYTNVFPFFGGAVGDLVFGTLRNASAVSTLSSKVLRCEHCGCSFEDIANSGSPGCPDCYRVFYDKLLPGIQRIHGKASYVGKVAGGAGEDVKLAHRKALLKDLLNRAIDDQNFERAAQLRDEIRELEARKNG